MAANPQDPEQGLTEAPVNGTPEHMLQLRIVPVGPLGVKEELDESKRIVVKYDPYMQVVNGMLGSSAGNMHRLGEILRDAVDGSAQGQFAEAITAAKEEGILEGRESRDEEVAGHEAHAAELQEAVKSANEKAMSRITELEKENSDAAATVATYETELQGRNDRIAELEAELAEAKKPAAQRAHTGQPGKKDDKD